jgi:hypothetical protein
LLHATGSRDETETDQEAENEAVRRRRRKKKRRQRRLSSEHNNDDESFLCLFLRTATVLALLSLACWSLYRHCVPFVDTSRTDFLDDDYLRPPPPSNPQPQQKTTQADRPIDPALRRPLDVMGLGVDQQHQQPEGVATLPPWPAVNLTARTLHWDAFALAEQHQHIVQALPRVGSDTMDLFWNAAKALRQEFTERYGNEPTARALLDRGLTLYEHDPRHEESQKPHNHQHHPSIPTSLQATACRMQSAQRADRPFRLAFGGYSVTAGRGNTFAQSYPFVLERLLHTPLHLAGMDLHVHNAAIGGCPAFPYGWCLAEFLGTPPQQDAPPDVVSWDFAMNEAGGDPAGLEAYLRRLVQTHQGTARIPQLLVRDTYLAEPRRTLLQNYSLWFPDALTLHTDPAAAPYLKLAEGVRPVGFQQWRKFGGPPGAPGQAIHHPAVAEHQLMAYLLAIHYLAALELVVLQKDLAGDDTRHPLYLSCPSDVAHTSLSVDKGVHSPLPAPFTWPSDAALSQQPSWQSLFVGDAARDWQMTPVSCRTTFEPIVSGDLSSLVVAGSVGEDLDILKPRSKMFYNQGWTLDLAHEEKQAKKNLLRYGGLGFIDSKKAYYGIEMSGWLRLLLPPETATEETGPQKGDLASRWFRSVVLCEVNEKNTNSHLRDDKATKCRLDQDVEFRIGGVNATASVQAITAGGALYLGKKVCIHLAIPSEARITTDTDLLQKAANESAAAAASNSHGHSHLQQQLPPQIRLPERSVQPVVGLAVEAWVRNPHIIQIEQACSISHVVWEGQLPAQMEESRSVSRR